MSTARRWVILIYWRFRIKLSPLKIYSVWIALWGVSLSWPPNWVAGSINERVATSDIRISRLLLFSSRRQRGWDHPLILPQQSGFKFSEFILFMFRIHIILLSIWSLGDIANLTSQRTVTLAARIIIRRFRFSNVTSSNKQPVTTKATISADALINLFNYYLPNFLLLMMVEIRRLGDDEIKPGQGP